MLRRLLPAMLCALAALRDWGQDWGQDPYYGGDGTTPPPTRSAALVVGDAAALGTDASVVDWLRARDYTVSVHDDNIPMQSAGIPRLTADGLAQFDRAVDHAADACH